jgi:hypothetical protein
VGLTFTVMVETPAPGFGTGFGLKVTVFPLPCPETDRVMGALKPPRTVVWMNELPEVPRETVIVPGLAMTLKPGATATTVRVTFVVSTNGWEVPVTVMVYVPGAVVGATVNVIVEFVAPVT